MKAVKFFRDQEKSFNFFRSFIRENFIPDDVETVEQRFSDYCDMILDATQKYNLTSLKSAEEVFEILFIDSLLPFTLIHKFEPGSKILDVGSGAGVPGLVLALVFPDSHFHLLDATRKKTQFMESVVQALGLNNVTVHLARAEDAGHNPDLREKFDYGVARSLAQLNILFEYVLPFLRTGGLCYAYKGALSPLEITRGEGALMELGGGVEAQKEYVLPFSGKKRVILSVKKTATCPDKYPRRAGIPKKRPL